MMCIAFCMAGSANAETPQEQADKLFSEGRDLIRNGDAAHACPKFEAAIALDRNAPGVMLNLGLCYEKLGKLATSLRWYRKAQVAASEAKPARLTDYEEAATARTAELVTRVAIVKVDVSVAPDVEVRIDGATLTRDDYVEYPIDAGTHRVEVRAPGKVTHTEPLEIADKQVKTITVPALVDTPRVVLMVDQNPGRLRRIAGITIGVLGVGLVAGSALYAKDISADFHVTGRPKNAHTRLNILTGTGIAGVAAAGLGVYVFLTAPKKEHNSTAFAPVVTNDQLGFAVTGGF